MGAVVEDEERQNNTYYQHPDFAALVGQNHWPTFAGSDAFRALYEECHAAFRDLAHHLLDLIADAAGLPREVWTDKFDRSCSALTGIYYPEPEPSDCVQGAQRLAAHADLNVLTILHSEVPENGCEALQLEIDGQWRAVRSTPEQLIVNIGEVLEILSKKKIPATRHRVVLPSQLKGSERLSLVYFCNPNHDAEFSTLPSCLKEGDTAETLNYGQYLKGFMDDVNVNP